MAPSVLVHTLRAHVGYGEAAVEKSSVSTVSDGRSRRKSSMNPFGKDHTEGQWRLAMTILALILISGPVTADGQIVTSFGVTTADALFRDGKLQAAQEAYLAVWKRDPANFQAAKQLGAIALYSNRLDEAKSYLETAIARKPADPAANRLLGECYYRQDDFEQAAKCFSAAGDPAKSEKLANFQKLRPYQVQSPDR